VLLRESDRLAALGYALVLSASNKTFLGVLSGRPIEDRRPESLAAAAFALIHGCRILRVHDVAGTVKVCRTIEAVLAADRERRTSAEA